MSLHIIMTRGLPGSGKTTWANSYIETHPTYKRVNRDSLREMIDNGKWGKNKEKQIKKVELLIAEHFLSQGFNVIIDDCNLADSARLMWFDLAQRLKVKFDVQDFTHVDVETCIERDAHRAKCVGQTIILKMYRDFLAPKLPTIVYNPDLPDAIIVDMDGTLALMNSRDPYNRKHLRE